MDNCIFCKIAKKEIPCNIVYEDSSFIAFLDISPVSKGHTILIPKKHSTNILEADTQTLEKIIVVAQKIAKILVNKLNAKGINILNNCGEVAGQTCFHTHIHIIPRYDDNDGFCLQFNKDKHEILSPSKIIALIK